MRDWELLAYCDSTWDLQNFGYKILQPYGLIVISNWWATFVTEAYGVFYKQTLLVLEHKSIREPGVWILPQMLLNVESHQNHKQVMEVW